MSDTILNFYDPLASVYHLIFEDWESTIERQAGVLGPIMASRVASGPLKILDCACGIGTQAIGFARRGHHVTASDLSPGAVARAKQEAEARSLKIAFHVSDMTSLAEIPATDFDVVAALDNALPHLSQEQLRDAVRSMGSKLRSGGLFLASTRDYDTLIVERPAVQGPVFYGAHPSRRIVHQVWDWIDHERYEVHHYITVENPAGQANSWTENWTSHHFCSVYRCVQRAEINAALESAGFKEVQWLMPAKSGYFQPIVVAEKI